MATATEKQPMQRMPQEGGSPHDDPIAYLQAKGWKCLGRPEWAHCEWLDPTQPLTSYYTEEPCMYTAQVREQYVDPVDGVRKIKYRPEERQILCQSGQDGQQQLAVRTVFHPAVTPVGFSQAMHIQLERDAVAERKLMAEREKARK